MPLRHALALLVVAALAACGGRAEVFEPQGNGPLAAGHVALPEPVPAVPVYLARLDEPLGDPRVRRIASIDGIAVVASVASGRVRVPTPTGPRAVRVAAVDPLDFRAVAPPATRAADFVWTSLLAGEAVMTFAAADRLGVTDGGVVEIPGLGDLPIGAFADNGRPGVGDVLIDRKLAAQAGIDDVRMLAIGAETGAVVEQIRARLKRRLPQARLTRLLPSSPAGPSTPRPVGRAEGDLIGAMSFRVLKGGFIDPDPAWVAANIATTTVPLLGTVTCHRLLLPQLDAALSELARQDLGHLVDPSDYGGCYVPRFIDRDPKKPLSLHAFGLAIDINVSTNQLGTRGDMDPRIVAIFEKWGFYWGGRFARPDPMHFELSRLMRL